jgi:hypothetical protein
MIDAIAAHLSEHGSTWIVVAVVAASQSFAFYRWLSASFLELKLRQLELEAVVIDSGLATVEETTEGRRRLATQFQITPGTGGIRSVRK